MRKKNSALPSVKFEYATGQDAISIEKERLSLAEKEYERQISDFQLVENKASFAMILFVAVLPMIVSVIEKIKDTKINICALVLAIITSVLSVVSFVCFVLVIISRKSHKVRVDPFCGKEFAQQSEIYFIASLIETYRKTVSENKPSYDIKHFYYKLACILMILDFIFSLVALFLIYCI